ncbi:MAG: hypothetical protein WBB09_10750 [Candidatus Microthrix parvicella]
MYKVILKGADGDEELDEVFESEADANEYGLVALSNISVGREVLHMSNPGDYPLSDDDVDFEVVEI